MTVSDQEIISRFPVGYHQLHPNVSLNFQMNRFWDWVERSVELFQAAARLFTPPVQPVEIPYENTTLPGYFYPGGDPAIPRPTVITHTGYDGCAEEMHFQCAAAAAERGYNVLSFGGPGQAGAVYRQRLVFRPDWENVVGPVIDYALTMPGVDGQKIVLWGLSMGGELAPRAAAFEHRLAALVCVDGLYDMGAAVTTWARPCSARPPRSPTSSGGCAPTARIRTWTPKSNG